MSVWESTFDLYGYAGVFPEVTGSPESVVKTGILVIQKETTPPPRCPPVGYTAREWMQHWVQGCAELGQVVRPSAAEEVRQECLRLIDRQQAQKNPAPVGAGNGR